MWPCRALSAMIRVWGLMVAARNPLKVVVKRIALVDMPCLRFLWCLLREQTRQKKKEEVRGSAVAHTQVTHDGRAMAEETERRT